MVNKISFKSKFGWITVIEDKKKILLISFGRSKNAGNLIYLKKFNLNLFVIYRLILGFIILFVVYL